MHEYPDVEQHLQSRLERTAHQYVETMQHTGMEPNETLIKAITERALCEAEAEYREEAMKTFHHNVSAILGRQQRRMNAVKREGVKMRLLTCPPVTLVFALLAWYSFHQSAPVGLIMGVLLSIGSLAFLLMLVLGAIFDAPQSSALQIRRTATRK